MKIAGVVVLYNPEETVLENIQTYLPFLNKLYVVDNSTKEITFLDKIKKLPKVNYISMDGNKGIALALKTATDRAIEEGFEYLLTMDHDSKYPTEDFVYIKKYIENNDMSKVGIIGINYTGSRIKVGEDKNFVEQVNDCISSGSIIVLENYKQISGFNPDLFIDLVDFDICCQFNVQGFKILMFKNILLNHKLGTTLTINLLLFKIKTSQWSPVRHYYYFRNFEYLKRNRTKEYYKYLKPYSMEVSIFARISKIFLRNDKKRRETARMIRQGIKDGKAGRMGEYKAR